MNQLPLNLSPRARECAVSANDTAALDAALAGAGWLTAADLCARLQWSDRKVRAVASASPRFVSFPGSPGYKLLRECTREEFEHFCQANRKQAREMIGRTVRAMREWYGAGRAA